MAYKYSGDVYNMVILKITGMVERFDGEYLEELGTESAHHNMIIKSAHTEGKTKLNSFTKLIVGQTITGVWVLGTERVTLSWKLEPYYGVYSMFPFSFILRAKIHASAMRYYLDNTKTFLNIMIGEHDFFSDIIITRVKDMK